jgi:hypothetical protein
MAGAARIAAMDEYIAGVEPWSLRAAIRRTLGATAYRAQWTAHRFGGLPDLEHLCAGMVAGKGTDRT